MNTATRTVGLLTRLVAGLVAGLLAGLLAGCGGAAGPEDPTATVPADLERRYLECMTRAGYPEVADGTLGEPNEDPLWDDPAFENAQQRCQESSGLNSLIEEHERDDVNEEEQDERVLAMVRCLRERGWEIDDPTRTDEGLAPALPQLDDQERQAAFNADFEDCADEAGVPFERDAADDEGQ